MLPQTCCMWALLLCSACACSSNSASDTCRSCCCGSGLCGSTCSSSPASESCRSCCFRFGACGSPADPPGPRRLRRRSALCLSVGRAPHPAAAGPAARGPPAQHHAQRAELQVTQPPVLPAGCFLPCSWAGRVSHQAHPCSPVSAAAPLPVCTSLQGPSTCCTHSADVYLRSAKATGPSYSQSPPAVHGPQPHNLTPCLSAGTLMPRSQSPSW